MAVASIQDRTPEFRSILQQAQRRQKQSRPGDAARQTLLNSQQQTAANGEAPTRRQRSEFARNAAQIGRGIAGTVTKLERLAQLARRKTLFDDRPVEIAELTYVIKQDLAGLNQQISQLQQISKGPNNKSRGAEQETEHNKNVVVLLQGRLTDVTSNFKEVLEVRTKNIQASRSRTENFVSSVGGQGPPDASRRTDSPLYSTPQRGRSPKPPQVGGAQDILSLDPAPNSSSALRGPQSDQQLLAMEEAQSSNSYISQRGEAIEAIERTIGELGGIFGQLAQMVSEQSEMIQRIDANTEDVVDNVQGAQRELLKYWGRVQGNRWLVAKMFGVLMACKCSPLSTCRVGLVLTLVKSFSYGSWSHGSLFTHQRGACGLLVALYYTGIGTERWPRSLSASSIEMRKLRGPNPEIDHFRLHDCSWLRVPDVKVCSGPCLQCKHGRCHCHQAERTKLGQT